MKLTSAIARQKAMNPNVQSGLQFRGSMGDRSTGIVNGPPPTPRAEPIGPRAPAETSPASASPRYQPQAQIRTNYEVNPNASWKPQSGTTANTPPPGPRAPYSVTPSGPGAPPPVHRQQTDQGNLTGSMGWRSTYYGPSLAERVAGMRHGAAPGQGMPAGTGTMNPDYTRNNNYWNLNNPQQQAGGSGAVFSTQPQTQQQTQQSPAQGGSGGGGGDFGTSRSALTGSSGYDANELRRRLQAGEQLSDAEMAYLRQEVLLGTSTGAQTMGGHGFDVDGDGNIYVDGEYQGNLYQSNSWSAAVWDALNEWGLTQGVAAPYGSSGSETNGFGQQPPPRDNGTTTTPNPEADMTVAVRDSGYPDASSLARALGVSEETLAQMVADGYSFRQEVDPNDSSQSNLVVVGPDGSKSNAMGSDVVNNYSNLSATQALEDLLNQGPPGFDQQVVEDRIRATQRTASMQNAESIAAAMQMAANAGVSPDAAAALIADAGQRQSVQMAAMEAEQRFQAEVQQKQAELSWVQSRLAILSQQAAFGQDARARQQATEASKELMAYQAQLQAEMADAQARAESASKLGSTIGMIGGVLIGGIATGLTGGAAAPLVPALGAAGSAAGGAIGGALA